MFAGGIIILKSNQRLFFTQKIVSPSKILFDEIFLVKKGNNSFKNCPIKLPSRYANLDMLIGKNVKFSVISI